MHGDGGRVGKRREGRCAPVVVLPRLLERTIGRVLEYQCGGFSHPLFTLSFFSDNARVLRSICPNVP